MSRPGGDVGPALPRLGPLGDGLVVAASAGGGPILLEGLATRVLADRRGPVESIGIGGREVAGPVRVDAGAVANVVVAPGVLKREWIGAGGSLLETVLASGRQPLVALQWSGHRPPLEISIALRGRTSDAGVRLGGGRVDVADVDAGLALAVHPTPDDLTIVRSESGPVAVVRPAASPDTTLLVAAGPPRTVDAALASAGGLGAQLALALRGPEEGLRLLTGIGAIDDGVAWARARLTAALSWVATRHGTPDSSAPDLLWATLAAAAVGDRAAAGHGLDALPGPGAGSESAERRALVAAGLLRAFGDPRPALEAARSMLAGGAEGRGTPSARALADALHGVASPDLLDRLRLLGPPARELVDRPRGAGRSLPMALTPAAETSPAAWMASLLDGEPANPAPPGRTASESALYGLVSGFRSTAETAWSDWRALVADGLERGPYGPGTWDGPDGTEEASGGILLPRTAALILGLTHGLLGLAPDARLGRLRIAPRLPRHLARLRVEEISSGSTRLALDYAREGSTDVFVLEPSAAAVPPVVVFEPRVYGAVRRVLIDGDTADLAVRGEDGGSVVPVLLAIDGTRRVEIETSRGAT